MMLEPSWGIRVPTGRKSKRNATRNARDQDAYLDAETSEAGTSEAGISEAGTSEAR